MDKGISFTDYVKRRRKELDLTQEELAERAGCSIEMLRRIETGRARPSRQLAELVGASLQLPQQEISEFVRWARSGADKSSTPGHDQAPSAEGAAHDTTGTVGAAGTADANVASSPLRNPYKGLNPFGESDARDFFGREALTARLLGRISEETEDARFLAVVGPSGSGKSSVVRAGLVPAIRRGALPGSAGWPLLEVTPGSHPFEELEAALLRIAVNPPATLMEQLRGDVRGLLRAAKRVLPGDDCTGLVLVVDQFEEVFTLVEDESERSLFLQSLHVAVTDSRSPLTVIATLRADFFDRPLLYPGCGDLFRGHTEVVLPLGPEELERAIVRPAEQMGVQFEPQLLATIFRDVSTQSGALPLLQYALTELFDLREGRLMTLSAYRASGGLANAISRRAEAIYQGLNAAEQEEARQLFLRLVTLGEGTEDTRRRIFRSEASTAARDEATLDRVLDLFGRHRLLTFDRDAASGRPTVDMAHEALLHNWPRLRDWLDASRESLRVHRRLTAATADWISAGRDQSFLSASGARLAQFEALDAGGGLALTEDERAYLAGSESERDRLERAEHDRQERELALARRSVDAQRTAAARLRYLVAALALFAAVATGLLLITLQDQRDADAARNEAEANLTRSEALRLAADASNLLQAHSNSELAALLTIRSLDRQYTAEGDTDLAQAEMLSLPTQYYSLTSPIMDMAISPDGKLAASANWDQVGRIWDIQTGLVVQRLVGHTDHLSSVAFSPDGKYLLTGSLGKSARVWDARTGHTMVTLVGHSDAINGVAFSPDGKEIATGSADGTVGVWDAATGRLIETLAGHQGPVNRVAFSPDGRAVLSAGNDKTARLWDVTGGQQSRVFEGHGDAVFAVAFSPDGRVVLTGSNDRTARLWDSQTGTELRRFETGAGQVSSVAFSPDGAWVLTGSSDNAARLWDAQSGRLLRTFYGHTDLVTSALFTPDGKWVLTGSSDATSIRWAADPAPELPVLQEDSGAILGGTFSRDGSRIATGSDSGNLRIWDAGSGRPVAIFPHLLGGIWGLALSPDGKSVFTSGGPGFAALQINIQTGRNLLQFNGASKDITSLALSRDGKYLVAGSADKTAVLWSTTSKAPISRLIGHDKVVTGVALSGDDNYALTSSTDATVREWKASTGSLVRTYSGSGGAIFAIALSPDGKHLATGDGDGATDMLDLQSGKVERVFSGHTGPVNSVAFSPDGRYLLTGSVDRTARLWDVQSGQELRRLAGHSDSVNSVAFSPDGTEVLTTSADGTARLWRVNYKASMSYLCSQLLRDLTDGEKAEYSITDRHSTCPGHESP